MSVVSIDRKIPFLVIVQSFLVGFFLDIKCLNYILGAYGFDENSNIMTLLYMVVIILILSIGFFQQVFSFNRFDKSAILLLLYLFLLFFISDTFLKEPYTSPTQFFVFTICAFIIPFVSCVDCRLLIKSVMLYPVIGITKISQIFIFVNEWNEWISMGRSYAFIIPGIASLLYLRFYLKQDKIFQRILYIILCIINGIYLLQVFQFGSRGPIICVVFLLLFLFCFYHSDSYHIIISKKRAALIFISISLLLLTFGLFLDVLQDFLKDIGFSSHAVDKFVKLTEEGDISHGRDETVEIAINGIMDHLLIGNGFDQFLANTGIVYPHNFVLQILYDGGLIFFCVFFIPVFRNIRRKYYNCSVNDFVLFSFLFFGGVFGALFSEDLWKHALLWFFVGFILCQSFLKKEENE